MNNIYGGYYPFEINYEAEEKKRQKKSLKSTSNKVGLFVTAYFLSMYLISIVLGVLTGSGMISKTSETQYFTQMLYSVGASFIPGIIFLLAMKGKVSDVLTKTLVKPTTLIPVLMFGMGVAMLANIAATIFDNNISIFELKNQVSFDMEGTTIFEFIMSVITTALVPAFAEEFAFRGLAMSYLRKHGDAFAIFGSSLLFGAMHGNTTQIIFAFLLGLIFAFVDVKTNSIIPSVIIHFVNNFYAVLSNTLIANKVMPEQYINIICIGLMAAFSLLGVLSAIYLSKADRDFFKLDDKTPETFLLSFKEKIGSFIANPGVLIALSLFTAEMIANLIPREYLSL